MRERHKKNIKPGEPPCQCPECLAEIRRLGGAIPFDNPKPAKAETESEPAA